MSVLIPKPFQPVKFTQFGHENPWACVDNPCQSLEGKCGEYSIGGKFAPIVTPKDKFSAQIDIALCGDETQVLQNPNFEDSEVQQTMQNPDFTEGSNGLEYWTWAGIEPVVTAGVVTLISSNIFLYQAPLGLDTSVQYIVEIEVDSISGTLYFLHNSGTEEITTTGTHTFLVYLPSPSGPSIYVTGADTAEVSSFKAFPQYGIADWNTTGDPEPSVQNNIVTISGAAGIEQNVANGTYYAVASIVEINGTATVGTETVSTTGTQGFIVHVTNGVFVVTTLDGDNLDNTVSISSIFLYEIAGEGDYDVEIYLAGNEPGTDSPVHTFSSAVGINGTIMSINFNWEDANLQDGYYFVSIAFECDGETYYLISNDFHKLADPECTVLIWACIGTDGNGFQNASFFPNMRLKPYFFGPKYVTDREINTDTAGYTSIYYASTEKTKELQTQALPEWVLDWLGTLPSYNAIYIAGEYWTTQDDEIQPEPDDSFPNWGTVNIVFKLNNNPLQMVRCTEEIYCADPPDQGPNCWQWTDGETIDWTDEKCIELVN